MSAAAAQEPEPEPTSPPVELGAVVSELEAIRELIAELDEALLADERVSKVAVTDASADRIGAAVSVPSSVTLSGQSVDDLAVAMAEASPGGGPFSGDPLSDTRVQLLAGLAVGLWLATRLTRLLVPGA